MTRNASAARIARPQTAIIAPEAFTPRVERVVYPAGETIAQLLTRACAAGALDPQDLGRAEVFIDGQALPDRSAALDYRPRPDQVVNIAVLPHGSNGRQNSNKALQVVLQVVVVAVSQVAGPWAAAAVQIGGQMALSALMKPKVDNLPSGQTYALTSQSNTARPRRAMPLVLGEGRVPFDLASSVITSVSGDDVFITAIYGIHYGACTATLPKLGETLFSDLPSGDLETEWFLTPGPRSSALYPMRTLQENYTAELEFSGSTPGAWVVRTTAEGGEVFELDLTFTNGLYFAKANGKTLPQEVQGRVEFSPAGANTWTAAPLDRTYYNRLGAAVPAGEWYFQARSRQAVRRTLRFTPPTKGQYDVRVRAWDPDNDDPDQSTYVTVWSAMRTIEHKAAIVDETLSILVARFRASSTINGALPTLSAVVTPIVPIWTPPAGAVAGHWNTTAASSNAAALARWLVTGPPAARPLSLTQIDVSFATAYQLIETYDWKGQVGLTDDISQQEALGRLGFLGRFSTYWNGSKLCAVSDWEKPAPRQMFTGLNAQGYKYSRAFPDVIHGVVVSFGNLDHDGDPDELVVYADGFTSETATILEAWDLPFKARANRAYREGRVWLAKRQYQSEGHAWSAGLDGLVSTYGDRVLVRHVSTLFGEAESRVQLRRFSGALISGVRLDHAVTMVEGTTYAIDVRRDDGAAIRNILLTTTPGRVRELVFAAPRVAEASPLKDDLVTFGRVDVVTEDVELIDIAPASSRAVALRAQPYRFADIQAAETGPIPPLQSRLSQRQGAPKPMILAASGTPDGAVVSFSVASQRTSPIASFTSRWRPTPTSDTPAPDWSTLPPLAADARDVRTPAFPDAVHALGDAEGEYRIDIEVRTVLQNGDVSNPAIVEGLLIARGVPVPVDFNAGGIKRFAPDGSAYPVLTVSAAPVEAGLIKELVVELQPASADPEAWISAGQPLDATTPYGDFSAVKGGAHYDVRAFNRTADGWRSGYVIRANVAIPAGSLVSSDTANVGGRPAAQIRDDLDLNALNIAEEILRGGTWRGETDALLYIGGVPVRTITQQLGVTTEGHTVFITSLQEVDGDGNAKAVFAINADGNIVGQEFLNDGTTGEINFLADILGVADPNGVGPPTKVLEYADGKWRFRDTIYVQRLIANIVETEHLVLAGVTTDKIAPQNVVIPLVSTGSSVINCDGTHKTIIEHTLDLTQDAFVFVTFNVSSHFPSGDRNWTARLWIDGVMEFECAGVNGVSTMPMSGGRYCAEGDVLVQVTLNSHSSVNVTYRTLNSLGPMR